MLCRAMSSRRWTSLLERFFSFFMERLPKRNVIVATDATGYSGRKRGWRETPYAHRPNEDWVKTHAAIEVDRFLVLSYELTASNVHDSQVFSDVWERLPKNIVPVRSLADSAYRGEAARGDTVAQDQEERQGPDGTPGKLQQAGVLRQAVPAALRRADGEAQSC
jgi:hypothetical protein